jgi:hypothetical protein
MVNTMEGTKNSTGEAPLLGDQQLVTFFTDRESESRRETKKRDAVVDIVLGYKSL